MKGWLLALRRASALERASGLRHLAMVIALGVLWAARRELLPSNGALWILGSAATLNFCITMLFARPARSRPGRALSSVFGLTGWTALAFLSGGPRSPFIAGLWLEIVFSAIAFPPAGTLLVTGAAAGALWLSQTLATTRASLGQLLLQCGFIAVIGAVTFLASKRWAQSEGALARRAADLDRRLGDLAGQLDATRHLIGLGEGVARVAHGLKNTVHSLRGFTKLIEGQRADAELRAAAVAGLHLAIDRLEEMAHDTLGPSVAAAATGAARPWTTAAEVDRTLDEVLDEVGRRHHGVRWIRVRAEEGLRGVGLSRVQLREVLLVLVENAAEASGAAAQVTVKATNTAEGTFQLVVRDRGPGLAPELGDRLFQPGGTTKAAGHGFGLFLARRLVEAQGGRISAAPALGGGALFSVTLPQPKN